MVVLYKDRLVRFGFELIENICKRHNVSIEIIDQTPKTGEQELVEDLIQIVTVFSCRLQGKHANKTKQILQEVKKLENDENTGERSSICFVRKKETLLNEAFRKYAPYFNPSG